MDEMNIFETAPSFPVIPLRGLVMFPDMVLHFDVGRKKSVAALKAAMNADQKIFLVSQKDAAVDEPGLDDLFGVGVILLCAADDAHSRQRKYARGSRR